MSARRLGTWVYYRIAERPGPHEAALLHSLAGALRRDDELQRDLERARYTRRSPCCDDAPAASRLPPSAPKP